MPGLFVSVAFDPFGEEFATFEEFHLSTPRSKH
jgi:hypothetical protein